MAFNDSLHTYYQLTKPGIIYGNLVTATAGFLLASKGNVNWQTFLAVLAGTALVIGSACVLNNILDRKIDGLMARTKKRALVSGRVSTLKALIYAKVLAIAGFLVLAIWVNLLVAGLAAIAVIFYVIIYGWVKRRSIHGALIGSIPGAAPPVLGYCAVTDHLDGAALILFLTLVFWQMPHFYGIALYRLKDYKAAKIPVMPARVGFFATKLQSIIYMLAFLGSIIALWAFGYAGWIYLIIVGGVGLYWLWLGLKNFQTTDNARWGRRVFLFSLVVNLVWSAAVSLNWLLVKL